MIEQVLDTWPRGAKGPVAPPPALSVALFRRNYERLLGQVQSAIPGDRLA